MTNLNRDAVKFAVSRLVSEVDYDIWKEYEFNEGFEDLTDRFIEAYEEDQTERLGVVGITEAQADMKAIVLEDEGNDVVFDTELNDKGNLRYVFVSAGREGDQYFILPNGDIES